MNLYEVCMKIKTAIENNTLIHFSHTDLDGYGCHLVTRKAVIYLNAKKAIMYNSDELGSKFQEFFEKIVKMVYYNTDKIYTFLVTDIGDFDIISFAEKFKGVKLNLIIIDHHKINDMDNVGEWYYNENGFTVYYDIRENGPNIHYIHTTECSATWIYANVLGYTNHKEFYYISEYDCGRWLEWRLDKTHEPSIMTKLNQALQIIKSAYSDEKDTNILNYLASYIKYIFNEYSDDEVRVFGKAIDYMVNNKCNENSRLYNKWKSTITVKNLNHYEFTFVVKCEDNGNEYDKKVKVALPNDPKYLGNWAIIIQEDKDEGPFSVYAKQYLEDHPNFKGIIRYTPNFKDIVSLRSASDDIDVSAIASLNGGGGHARAAGFVAKPEILM